MTAGTTGHPPSSSSAAIRADDTRPRCTSITATPAPSTTFSADDPWLGDDAIGNDSADSIRIQQVPFCDLVSEIPKVECEALVSLYNSTFGPSWTNRTGWLTTYTPCSWYGITCAGGHVTGIHLSINNLSGSLPDSLGNLDRLRDMALTHNSLTGNIPSTLGNLSSLRLLYLYSNQLSGSIPSSFGGLVNLTDLHLEGNKLSGSIPSALTSLPNLQALRLARNQLSGSIPSALGSMTNLVLLDLSENQLTGSIPSTLGSLTNLHSLALIGNQLTGSIPLSLGNLSNLRDLYVNNNPLTGPLPQSLTNLSLEDFAFQDTNLCEPPDQAFQSWLAGITRLWRTGVQCPFCDVVSEIPKAECEALVAFYNSTFGPSWTNRSGWLANYYPCTWHGVTCGYGHVTDLVLPHNNLSGTLPGLSGLGYLVNLDLSENYFIRETSLPVSAT